MTDPNPTRLTRRVAPWFEAAYRTHALGERLQWDIVFGAVGSPDGQVVPLLTLYTEIPAAVLGTVHLDITQIPTVGLDEARVDHEVQAAITRLLQVRSAALATTNGGAAVRRSA